LEDWKLQLHDARVDWCSLIRQDRVYFTVNKLSRLWNSKSQVPIVAFICKTHPGNKLNYLRPSTADWICKIFISLQWVILVGTAMHHDHHRVNPAVPSYSRTGMKENLGYTICLWQLYYWQSEKILSPSKWMISSSNFPSSKSIINRQKNFFYHQIFHHQNHLLAVKMNYEASKWIINRLNK
jgi:hypothetical protein